MTRANNRQTVIRRKRKAINYLQHFPFDIQKNISRKRVEKTSDYEKIEKEKKKTKMPEIESFELVPLTLKLKSSYEHVPFSRKSNKEKAIACDHRAFESADCFFFHLTGKSGMHDNSLLIHAKLFHTFQKIHITHAF